MFILTIIIYLMGNVIFLLPCFKSYYKYSCNKENYNLENRVIFKKNWFSCDVIEEVMVNAKDELIYDKVTNDLILDGFKEKKNSVFKRNIKNKEFCKSIKKEYEKIHNSNYVNFSVNGNLYENILYGNDYLDPYINAVVGGKKVNEVEISSNLNKNRLGKYLITYTLNVADNYNERIYRVVNVYDDVKPEIMLEGDEALTVNYKSFYTEPGFYANDNYDGNITSKVKVKNPVNTKKPGVYKVTYTVSDSSGNKTKKERKVVVNEKDSKVNKTEPVIEKKDGLTYVNGILLVNKNYGLPKEYNPKVDKEALSHLKNMQSDASALGLDLSLVSGYRSYETQEKLFNKYVQKDGEELANTYSARPGYSEHQTGLAFDIGSVDRTFENTTEAKWIEENAHLYGFIIRYPKNKTSVTGYIYEPWHIRYLGIDKATKVKESGLALEEYLGIN